jgi:hypothetical protein
MDLGGNDEESLEQLKILTFFDHRGLPKSENREENCWNHCHVDRNCCDASPFPPFYSSPYHFLRYQIHSRHFSQLTSFSSFFSSPHHQRTESRPAPMHRLQRRLLQLQRDSPQQNLPPTHHAVEHVAGGLVEFDRRQFPADNSAR